MLLSSTRWSSDALISLRSRGRFSRPFEAVDELQRQAQARLQDTHQQLNQHLSETERTLATLRHSTDPHEAQLPEKQREALSLHENRQRKIPPALVSSARIRAIIPAAIQNTES